VQGSVFQVQMAIDGQPIFHMAIVGGHHHHSPPVGGLS
jgi:hypothetical protein